MRFHLLTAAALIAVPVWADETPPKRYIDVPGAPVAAEPAAAPAKATSKIICRRDIQIGSWVKGTRRCGTQASWEQASRAGKIEANTLRDGAGAMIMEQIPQAPQSNG